MNHRLRALRARLEAVGVDALLVSKLANVRYLLGRPTLFDSHFRGPLLITRDTVDLLVDFRYVYQAEQGQDVASVRRYTESAMAAVGERIAELAVDTVGIESDFVSVAAYEKLRERVKAVLVPTSEVVERLRIIKEDAEVESIRRAAAIGDRTFDEIRELVRPGVAEEELAMEIEYRLRRGGAEAVSFEPIVASGPNAGMPHARAGDRLLCQGDFLVLDFGCVAGGYCSDMTRTVIVGRAGEEQRELYGLVLEAQERAMAALGVGRDAADIDRTARDVFAARDQAEYFGHNLGHGVGLDVHELPTLGRLSKDVLAAGMVFTVEPGLYYEHAGVRIEDMVLLTDRGVEVLTASPKALLEL